MKKCKKILALILSVLMVALMVPLNGTVIKSSAADAVDVLLWSPTALCNKEGSEEAILDNLANALSRQSISYNRVIGTDTLSNLGLSNIKLVVVFWPHSAISSSDMNLLKSYVSGGGHLMLIGEYLRFSRDHGYMNDNICAIGKTIGFNFKISPTSTALEQHFTVPVSSNSDLLKNVKQLTFAAAATISDTDGATEVLSYNNNVCLIGKRINKGYVTFVPDGNFFGYSTDENIGNFLINCCSMPTSTSNSMFGEISTEYNHELAQFCADFSLYGYSMSSIDDKLNDVGFTLVKKDGNADRDEVNYFIATKDEEQNGIMKKLIFVGCIGSHKKQWYSNFDPLATERDTSADRGGAPYANSSTKAHLGFADALEYVYYNLSNYIKDLNNNGVNSENIKVFLTGHSRGAATANLLAARLVDEQNLSNALVKPGNIYAYTFATPRPTTDKNSSKYDCIFNIVNPEDMVTKVMLQTWGYNRYGITYTLPSKTNDKNWKDYLSAMRVYFKEYTGYEYEPYPNGEKATYNIINKMGKNVKSPSELYTEKFSATWYWGWEIKLVNKWTTFDFFKKTLLPFVAGESVDWGTLAGVILGPGFFFPSILLYFASPDADLPKNISVDEMVNILKSMFGNKFREAHEAETYYSYMHSLTEDQLTETRKGYKGTVNCPVDIEIYDKETGELVGRIVNNTIDEEVAASENAVVVYVEGDSKSFWLPSNGDYEIRLIGNDEGTMDYTMSEIDSDAGEMSRVNFFDVEITDGLTMTSDIVSEDFIIEEYELTFEDGETLEPTEVLDEEDITVYNIEIITTEGGSASASQTAKTGDYVSITATANEGWNFAGWYENGELLSKKSTYAFVAKSDRSLTAKFDHSHTDENHDGYCDICEEMTPERENCSCNCHKGGIIGFFFKIILFFQKIFKTNKTCACGIAHY